MRTLVVMFCPRMWNFSSRLAPCRQVRAACGAAAAASALQACHSQYRRKMGSTRVCTRWLAIAAWR